MSATGRIEYIDALRGFTMILVVFHHIMSLGMGIESSVCSSLFITFRMPLFFFISGFIASKTAEIPTWKIWAEKIRKKTSVQLLPTLVFGLLFTYVVRHEDIGSFLMHRWKFGYWFTISLLEMFLIYYTAICLTGKFFRRKGGGRKCDRPAAIILVSLAATLYLLKYALKNIGITDQENDLLCLQDTFFYFQFFVFGNLAARNQNLFERLLDKKYFLTGILILFTVLFLRQTETDPGNNTSAMLQSAEALLCRYCGLLIVYSFFRCHQANFTQTKPLGKALQYVGRRTLDIYMLHYFLLPHLPEVGEYLLSAPNSVLELSVGITLSLLVTGICLIISSVLRLSEPLSHYLFGAKPAHR
ncbi:acyltransferase [uncultured Alistipes sp.]|uniref:acyltransferase family protein n=1 Tax=uncultured Alistipes sp. TaxID=538949 RepID=UPI0025A514C2|nr:acyltransferase [uncultured Alistipes sp.]MCX4282800.1 acyltransferase [Alistipes sp.]